MLLGDGPEGGCGVVVISPSVSEIVVKDKAAGAVSSRPSVGFFFL